MKCEREIVGENFEKKKKKVRETIKKREKYKMTSKTTNHL
jgi:hypothetical protein